MNNISLALAVASLTALKVRYFVFSESVTGLRPHLQSQLKLPFDESESERLGLGMCESVKKDERKKEIPANEYS